MRVNWNTRPGSNTRRHEAISAYLGPLVYARKAEEVITALRLAQAAVPEVLQAHRACGLGNSPLQRLRHAPQLAALPAWAGTHTEVARPTVLVNTRYWHICNDDECSTGGRGGSDQLMCHVTPYLAALTWALTGVRAGKECTERVSVSRSSLLLSPPR